MEDISSFETLATTHKIIQSHKSENTFSSPWKPQPHTVFKNLIKCGPGTSLARIISFLIFISAREFDNGYKLNYSQLCSGLSFLAFHLLTASCSCLASVCTTILFRLYIRTLNNPSWQYPVDVIGFTATCLRQRGKPLLVTLKSTKAQYASLLRVTGQKWRFWRLS